MTTIGEGRIVIGRWWIYIDLSRQFVGRDPADESVVYAIGPLVFEHLRPEHHAQAEADRRRARAEAQRARAVARWQGIRNGLWMTAHVLIAPQPGETSSEVEQRRRDYVRDVYRVKAAEERARHPNRFVPALEELRIHARQPAAPAAAEAPEVRTHQPAGPVEYQAAHRAAPEPAPSAAATPNGRPALTLITKD